MKASDKFNYISGGLYGVAMIGACSIFYAITRKHEAVASILAGLSLSFGFAGRAYDVRARQARHDERQPEHRPAV